MLDGLIQLIHSKKRRRKENKSFIPAEFDPQFYQKRYKDLRLYNAKNLKNHYLTHGRTEGRRANRLNDREDFARLIPSTSTVLEIGAFCKPLTQFYTNVKYFDVLDRDQLLVRAEQLGEDPTHIPKHIDFVSPSADLSIISEQFEFVISSHVIEHQLDLLQHLKEVERLLEPGGYYFVLIPDKRYCYDHFIPESNLASVLEAYHLKKKHHPLSSVLAQRVLTTHNDPRLHWLGIHGEPFENLNTKIDAAIKEYEDSCGSYIDVHRWYFTPDSFLNILSGLRQIEPGLLTVGALYPTRYGSTEFWVVLKKP